MKKMIFIVVITLLSSCGNHNYLISDSGVGKFKLKEKINYDFNKNDLDITKNNKGEIKSIIIKTDVYKNKDGFGVGSSLEEINLKYKNKSVKKDLALSKGSITIGKLGKSVILGNVIFVDSNIDGKVDYVWINKVE